MVSIFSPPPAAGIMKLVDEAAESAGIFVPFEPLLLNFKEH